MEGPGSCSERSRREIIHAGLYNRSALKQRWLEFEVFDAFQVSQICWLECLAQTSHRRPTKVGKVHDDMGSPFGITDPVIRSYYGIDVPSSNVEHLPAQLLACSMLCLYRVLPSVRLLSLHLFTLRHNQVEGLEIRISIQ